MSSPVIAGLKHHQNTQITSFTANASNKSPVGSASHKSPVPFELGGLPPKGAYHRPQAVKAATHAIVSAHGQHSQHSFSTAPPFRFHFL